MQVQDIMTSELVCCTAQTSLQDVAQMMQEHDCGVIPVIESESSPKPLGIVSDRDITVRAVAQGLNPLEMTVGEVMSTPVYTVRKSDSLDKACNLMEKKQVRRVVVIDDRGECCGIVAQADIARNLEESASGEVVQNISQPTNGESRLSG